MYPTLQIGGAAVPLRPVIFLIAFWICLTLSERRLAQFGVRAELAWNFGMIASGVGLVAARLWYALSSWSAYQANLSALFAPTLGTLAINEGAFVGLVAGLIYLRRRQVSLRRFADAFTPGLLIAFGLASVGALLSGDAYGAPADLPWAINLWNERRHPSQIYELLVALMTLAIVSRLKKMPDGFTFLTATALYAMGRMFIEAFRGDSLIMAQDIRTMQLVWLAVALLAVIVMCQAQFHANQNKPG